MPTVLAADLHFPECPRRVLCRLEVGAAVWSKRDRRPEPAGSVVSLPVDVPGVGRP